MDLLKDKIPSLVRKLAVPASVGTLFQTLYNIVDTFFAGKISPEALSALSKSFPIYFILVATSIGVTIAGTSLIGNSIGENDKKKVLYYFSNTIYFGVFISIIITFLGLYFSETVFLLMGSTNEVTLLGLEYTNVIFSGTIIFIMVVALNSLLHAEGDTKTFRNALIFSFFLNIILNPILIFGFMFIPAFGVKGIGIATIISQTISLFIVFYKVMKNQRVKEMTKEFFLIKYIYLKDIFFQSMPISVAICGYSIASAIIFTYVGSSGEEAAAGYGAATRIEQVVLLPVLGINTAIISIIAQNYGAGNYLRIKQSYYTAIKYAFIIMVTSGIFIYITSGIIPTFFSDNLEVIHYGKKYLQISAFVLPAYPIFFLSNGFFMALKKSENALITNFFRNIILPIVTFYVATYFVADFNTFFWIWVISNWIFSVTLLFVVLYYIKNKLNKTGAVIQP
ncbi:MAG: MATE family efflux transporter [Candidatus Pelagibacter sp.]|nr:MATE family efflux transporter [Candidatus Pelagibacter sp.]|tara:strand:- start:280 stop:1635 length:1356 start_codon:yes stop_codon:yes gene_type:complete